MKINWTVFRQSVEKWLRALAPLPISVACVALVWIIWCGGWDETNAPIQLQWLGIALILLIVTLGLWQTFKEVKSLKATVAGNEFSINGSVQSDAPQVTEIEGETK